MVGSALLCHEGNGSISSGPRPVSHQALTTSLEAHLQDDHMGLAPQHAQLGTQCRVHQDLRP